MSRCSASLVVLLLSATLFAASHCTGQAPQDPPPREGVIVNLDAKPFAFRLARRSGALWSETMTLASGQSLTLRSGSTEELEGITGDGKGHVTIEYPELGGKIRLQLPALDPVRSTYVPFWYHVKDANGFSRMVQAASKDDAEAKHKALLAEPPFTPAELEAVKRMLRANFVLIGP